MTTKTTKPFQLSARSADLRAAATAAKTKEEHERAMAAIDLRIQELEAGLEAVRTLRKEASRCLN